MPAPQCVPLPIHGAYVLTMPRHADHRGFFNEYYNATQYPAMIKGSIGGDWRQASASFTKNVNTIRGLHLSPYNKFCTVITGAVYDVFVDMREDSPTFLKWCGVHLTEENRKQVHIPAKCAHGFLTLAPNTRMFYLQGGTFDPVNESDIFPFDKLLDVAWPLSPDHGAAIVSQKDQNAPSVVHSSRRPHLAGRAAMKRVLIVGASGQVGGALTREYEKNGYAVYGTHLPSEKPGPNTVPFDLAAAAKDPQLAEDLIDTMCPHVIVISAAYTFVDGAEDAKDLVYAINVDGPAAIAAAGKRVGAKFVTYSTDYVWDGTKGPYDEEDPPCPKSVYGWSKLDMEKKILALDSNALMLRTAVVYGPEQEFGKNFVYQLSRKLMAKERMRVMTDQVSSPTYNRDLALLTRLLHEEGASGVFCTCGKETLGRFDFAKEVGKALKLDTSLLDSCLTSDLNQKAPRPLVAGMKLDKALNFLKGKYKPRSIAEAIADWKANPSPGDVPLGPAVAAKL